MPNPIDKYRQNAVLEGGSTGASSGSGIKKLAETAAITAGGAGIMSAPLKLALMAGQKAADNKQKDREAADEIKRETRGVEKTSTDRARDDAREIKMQQQNEKASREASRDMGFSKGGMASRRADGIAQKGKTKGKIIAMCGGGYSKGKK